MSLPLKEVIKIAERQLQDAGVSDYEIDAKDLMCLALNVDRTGLLMHWTDVLQDKQLDRYFDLVAQRASRIPAQHILGTQEFMGMTFKVNPQVLIPRQDTETMVEDAIELLTKGTLRGETYGKPLKSGAEVLDLCTGSGAIAISLAKACPDFSYTASDVSTEALAVAKENCEALGAKVKLVESDMFNAFSRKTGRKGFSFIISNPPYIVTKEIEILEPEVRDHEPRLALDGGVDGLNFYRTIVSEAPRHLRDGGVLMMEIGYDQGTPVTELMRQAGVYSDVRVLKDMAGKDRIVCGRVGK